MPENKFLGYDTDDVGLLPEGRYAAVITRCEIVDTQDKTGKILALVFIVTEGKFNGYEIENRLNIHNKSLKAQKIAREENLRIMEALGNTNPTCEEDYCNITINIDVKQKENNYFDPPRMENVITRYSKYELKKSTAKAPAAQSTSSTDSDSAAPVAGDNPPWDN